MTYAAGLDLFVDRCNTSAKVTSGHVEQCGLVQVDTSKGHQPSNCANDKQCWVYVYTGTGKEGYMPSGLPIQPQSEPCGQAEGTSYMSLCGEYAPVAE